jgi:hypothetical protein
MTSTVQERLASWRMLLEHGGPAWLMKHAPRIVRELEAEASAQVDRNPKDHDAEERHGAKHESPVANGDAPQAQPQGGDA